MRLHHLGKETAQGLEVDRILFVLPGWVDITNQYPDNCIHTKQLPASILNIRTWAVLELNRQHGGTPVVPVHNDVQAKILPLPIDVRRTFGSDMV